MPPKKQEEIEKEFEEIGAKASTDAAGVKCSTEEYIAGLKGIIDTLKTDVTAAGGSFGGLFDD